MGQNSVLAWPIALLGLFILFGEIQAVTISRIGTTFGKRAMGMRVVKLDGSMPRILSAMLREGFTPAVSLALCGLGGLLSFLSTFFDTKTSWNRGWYDQVAGTLVVSEA